MHNAPATPTSLSRLLAKSSEQVDAVRDALIDLSHSIHDDPELAFAEHRSSARVAALLDGSGFRVQTNFGGLETAFDAVAGTGPLHVALFAEYDALPEVGHACGHNIIAAAAAGAGIALAPLAEQLGLTVHVIGTPAEESGGGKELLLQRGAFDGLAAAAMIHPGPTDIVDPRSLAIAELTATFTGRASHAAAAPEHGINAADGATVSQVALGLLRQHLRRDQMIHGIVTDGGSAPNIIPERAALHYLLRAGDTGSLHTLVERASACFNAGALASGSTVLIEELPPRYLELRANAELLAACASSFEDVGRMDRPTAEPMGSTDMGNVMAAVPGIHPMIAVGDGSAALHQREFADAARSPSGDAAVLDGARILAQTMLRLATDHAARDRLIAATHG